MNVRDEIEEKKKITETVAGYEVHPRSEICRDQKENCLKTIRERATCYIVEGMDR